LIAQDGLTAPGPRLGRGRYDKGTLEQWATGDTRPPWTQVRSVLLDALQGLGHLHASAVIHGDVKPANILVDGRERGCLADFDISIDTKDRTSAAHITRQSMSTIRAKAQGMTADYAAPELKELEEATRHTDMFAFGRTVEAVNRQCEPGDAASDGGTGAQGVNEQARGQTATLIQALTAPSPHDRPTAEAAAQLPFFTILRAACQRVSKTCLLCDLAGDDGVKDAAAGAACSEGHFHCASHVSDLAKSFLAPDNLRQLQEREGLLKCSKYPQECNSGFADRDLAQHLPADLFKTYLEARLETVKAQTAAHLEAEMKTQLEAELQRLTALGERARKVLVARTHIVDKILTLACPRPGCGQAFLDFDGCFALKCSRCPCGFCGWCLADCGNDAHEHVRQCDQKPPGADVLFGSQAQFAAAQKRRQKGLVRRYLDQEVDAEVKAEVEAACRAELEANDLWPVGA